MLNKIELIGRLGADPKGQVTATGSPVSNFSIATNRKYKDKNGELITETEWHQVVVFGAGADYCNQYLHKGRLVRVGGRIKTEKWEDNEGNQRQTVKVIAEDFVLALDGANGNGNEDNKETPPAEEI